MNREELFNKISQEILNEINMDEDLNISCYGENSHFIRFNNSKVRQIGDVSDIRLSIDLFWKQRTCGISFTLSNDIDIDIKNSIEKLNALRNYIKKLPEDPFIVLPSSGKSSSNTHTGETPTLDQSVSLLSPAIAGVDLTGIWASGFTFIGHTNSKNQSHWFSTESFSFDYSLSTPQERMVKDTFAGNVFNQDEYHKFINNSISHLDILKKDSVQIDPGKYRTYIAPAGVSDLIDMLSWNGLSEGSMQRGRSAFLKMRKNNLKLSPCFSLHEDFSTGFVPSFNECGELSPEKLPLINEGALINTMISTRTAKEFSLQSNFSSSYEELRSPAMATGDLKEDAILEEIDSGVYLSNLHYLNWSDNLGGRITGMTRYACFWVENGKVVAPIENMRFDDSIYNFFGNNLEAVTDKSQLIPTVQTYEGREFGGVSCPGILLKSFELTL